MPLALTARTPAGMPRSSFPMHTRAAKHRLVVAPIRSAADGHLPLVVPSAVIPPPSQGSQYGQGGGGFDAGSGNPGSRGQGGSGGGRGSGGWRTGQEPDPSEQQRQGMLNAVKAVALRLVSLMVKYFLVVAAVYNFTGFMARVARTVYNTGVHLGGGGISSSEVLGGSTRSVHDLASHEEEALSGGTRSVHELAGREEEAASGGARSVHELASHEEEALTGGTRSVHEPASHEEEAFGGGTCSVHELASREEEAPNGRMRGVHDLASCEEEAAGSGRGAGERPNAPDEAAHEGGEGVHQEGGDTVAEDAAAAAYGREPVHGAAPDVYPCRRVLTWEHVASTWAAILAAPIFFSMMPDSKW